MDERDVKRHQVEAGLDFFTENKNDGNGFCVDTADIERLRPNRIFGEKCVTGDDVIPTLYI